MIDLFFTQDLGSKTTSKAVYYGGHGGKRRKPEYHFENLEHEKNDGSIFHARFGSEHTSKTVHYGGSL
jgi:hypothetical protein